MVFLPTVLLALASAATFVQAQTFTGSAIFNAFGLGACGITNSDSDIVVAVSALFFDNFPGATSNPNLNPLCGRKLTATFEGKSVTATIEDRCASCSLDELDFSPAAFSQLASPSLGRLQGVTWTLD